MPVAHMLPVDGKIAVFSPNWLGDCVMSMPAVEALRRKLGRPHIVAVVRPWLADLWRMCEAVEEVVAADTSGFGFLGAALAVRRVNASAAVIFPNSFRSAFIAYLAGIPMRVGAKGHWRVWMLTDVVSLRGSRRHQAAEYLEIAGAGGEEPAPPRLVIPEEARAKAEGRLPDARKGAWIAVFPGAARGPAKRWPPEYFAETIMRICRESPARAAVLGSASEGGACERVASLAAPHCVNLCGELNLRELAALLGMCRLTLCNDSGGMHLSAAVGTPVVAIFGITDPSATGPLGSGHRILTAPGAPHSRFVGRTSRTASEVLASIRPEEAAAAALEVLRR